MTRWCTLLVAEVEELLKLCRLAEGFEASFLVLEGDPIENFEQIRNILLRVKQGRHLALETPDKIVKIGDF